MKNYMVNNFSNIRPIRQIQRDKKSTKAPISDRNGVKTAKYAQRQNSKESFDNFVQRMKKDNKSTETYGFKARPYTSNGYNHLRIKHQQRPMTKSRTDGKR